MHAYHIKNLTLPSFNLSVGKRIYTREVGKSGWKGLVEWVKAVVPSGIIAFFIRFELLAC
jgi:hypothetical protein